MRSHCIKGIIRHHECDAGGEIKLHCLLDRLQDAAAEHAAKLNVGMEDLAEMRLIWVLSRLKIRLIKPLKLGDDLEVMTYPSGVERIFAHRCYDLMSGGGRCGFAGSLWLPVNTVNNRPVAAKKVLSPEIVNQTDVEKFFPDMDKLPDFSGIDCGFRQVGAGDVDLNGHLNNAVYARWITDILGELTGSKAVHVREIQLNYLNAGQFGEKIFLSSEAPADGGVFRVSGRKADGTAVFQAAGQLEMHG